MDLYDPIYSHLDYVETDVIFERVTSEIIVGVVIFIAYSIYELYR